MNVDIRTLAVVLGITNLLQVIAIFLQYRVNKTYRGIGWWALGFAAVALGFVLLILRDVVPMALISIISGNVLTVLGSIMLYIGIMQFLDRKENRGIVISIFAVFLLPFLYYILVKNDITARTVIASAALATISFLTAQGLFVHKSRAIAASANFISAVFFTHGCYFAIRAVATLTVFPIGSFFTPTLLQVTSFLDPLIAGILLTFGFIIMVNQRLNADSREAREHFELIFNTSPDASLITRLTDGVIVNINDGFTALTGFTRDEAVGKSSLDIHIWKDPADRQKVVDDLRKKGFCENFEAIFQRKDGSPIIGMMSAKMLNLQGAPHIISVTHDITERKRTEEGLRFQSEIMTNMAEAVYLIRLEDGAIVYTNSIFERMFGYEQGEMLGKHVSIVNAPTDKCPEETAKEIMDIINQKGFWKGEIKNIKKDGTHFWCYASVSIFDHSKYGRVFVTIHTDINERKQTEAALKESELRYRELFDNISSGVAIYEVKDDGNDFIFKDFNKAGERLDGDRKEDIIGKSIYQARPGIKPFGLLNVFERVWKTGIPEHYPATFYEDERFKKWFENYVYKLPTGDIVAVYDDVTERKQAEEKIQASLREKETMLKEIHHRVKNNLQVISSLLGLQSSYLQDEKSRKIFQESRDRVRIMANIHTMLYQSEDLARVDFGEFIRDLVGRLQQSYGIAGSSIEVHVDVADVSLTIETSVPCGLILNELVSNALKHAFPEGRGGEINIRMATAADQFVLKVQDNGIGFPASVDFRKTQSLGLELVNLLVGQMNGTIDLKVEGGTTFTIQFPAVSKGG